MNARHMILIVEDDASIRRFVRISLEAHRFEVLEARLGTDGLEICEQREPDLVILDLGLPDMDGMEFLVRLREWSRIPVIVLSVRAAEEQKVAALDAGANDYVTKPFGIGELIARIRALLRDRASAHEEATVYHLNGLKVDLQSREVTVDGEAVHLTRKEYDLLHLLIRHAGQVLTHEQLLNEIWGPASSQETHYLRVLVRQLRKKLEEDATAPRFLQTVQGVGYRFDLPGD